MAEALEWIVAEALTKDREERTQSARELLKRLQRLKQRVEAEAEIERSVAPEGLSRASSGSPARSTPSGVSNLWAQPVDGGPARQLTTFTSEHIFWFDYSRDGKQLALSRGTATSDVILIGDFR